MEYLIETIVLFLTASVLVLYYFNLSYKYWKQRKIVYIKPRIPFGSFGNPFWDKKGVSVRLKEAYQEIKDKSEIFGGFYIGTKPVLLATSPEAVKTVLHTAFDHFEGHGNVIDEKREPLSAHLANLNGERWKNMRVKLTPTFTSGKMKMMFPTILDCGGPFEDHVRKCWQQKQSLDVRETLARFTTDIIGSCAFGLECNSFKNPDAEFRTHGKKIFTPSLKTMLRRIVSIMSPKLVKMLKLPFFDNTTTNFFMGTIRQIVNHRKTNNITRNDFVQILMNMEEAGFTIEEIAAQAFVFFLAGFETSSTTMTFCFYELAHHQNIQEKIRDEIKSVIKRYDGKITYEGIMEMKYLEQVINETLRKHPPVPAMKRLCNKDYKLPNGTIMERGHTVFMSVLGLHRDEEFYPNPEKFDPERFSDENIGNIPPYAFIPFGEGPRICIGLRFGMLQTKIGLCLLLRNYRISPHKSLKYPIEYEPNSFILNTKGNVLLNLEEC